MELGYFKKYFMFVNTNSGNRSTLDHLRVYIFCNDVPAPLLHREDHFLTLALISVNFTYLWP
jgi:hypothetical protein